MPHDKDSLKLEIIKKIENFNLDKLQQIYKIIESMDEASIDIVKKIYLQFCEVAGAKIVLNPKKVRQIKMRLVNFTEEELIEAIKFRKTIPWYAGDNVDKKEWYKDWESLFRNDEKVENILSRMPKEKRQTIKGKVLFT